MKYVKKGDRDIVKKLCLPKDLEYKIFGKVITDLERGIMESDPSSVMNKSLLADIQVAKQIVRSRDDEKVSSLAGDLRTQSIISSRSVTSVSDAYAFFIQYQLGAFLKKFPFKGIDTAQPAFQKFLEAECVCARFNNQNYQALVTMDKTFHPILGGSLQSMRDDIESLLGAEPNIERVEASAFHGPGTSLGPLFKNGETTSYFKWRSLPYSVTKSALPYARSIIESDPRWIGALDDWYRNRCGNRFQPVDMKDFWSRIFTIVDANRITTVPKSAIIDRTIAIEPLMNVFLQLGVDRVIRTALKQQWGIDLNDQEVNQHLAKLGAMFGSYATIDLSAASDTISLKICELLLPPAWYNLLLDLRSAKGLLKGVKRTYDKMSSMGNGFTFALETVIFAAVSRHVLRRIKSKRELAVYGDDIVIDSAAAPPVIDLLEYCGFAINKDKSFTTGPFRESCGSDWFLRYNVRPVFLKRTISNVCDLFYAHNALYELQNRLEWSWDIRFDSTLKYIRSLVPKSMKNVYGPPSENLDQYLFSDRKPKGVGQDRWHLAIRPTARKFNRNTDFYFRKLMCDLKPPSSDLASSVSDLIRQRQSRQWNVDFGDTKKPYRWDKKRVLTTGNSFDVTKRDYVRYVCTKQKVW